ncbi:MAG: ABC transporter permease, partial [Oscillospiraceae bacterium]|nr:ABC transporter permease [Oscillospiraceae bacterium]
ESEYINIVRLEENPKVSKLVIGRYDAIIIFEDDSFKVETTRGEDVRLVIEGMLTGEITEINIEDEETRGAVSNILGFNMILTLLLGLQIYMFYFEERGGINKRIVSTNVSYLKYLFSHFAVVLIYLFIPAVVIITSSLFLFNLYTSIAISQIVFIIFVLCFFGASFGLFISTVSKSLEASFAVGNMFVILTSLISGSFVAVTDNRIFTAITQILPQRQIMDHIGNLENMVAGNWTGMVYVMVVSLVLILIGTQTEKRLMSKR